MAIWIVVLLVLLLAVGAHADEARTISLDLVFRDLRLGHSVFDRTTHLPTQPEIPKPPGAGYSSNGVTGRQTSSPRS